MSKTTSLTDYFFDHYLGHKTDQSSFHNLLIQFIEQQIDPRFSEFFTEVSLLSEALSHRSFVHEFPALSPLSYERYEFLGDAFLSLYMTNEIFRRLPEATEGQMSKLRASLINEKMLFNLSKKSGLDRLILVGRGEMLKGDQFSTAIVSDIFEAILGHIFFHQGQNVAAHFLSLVIANFDEELIDLSRLDDFDFKSKLQSFFLANFNTLPTYHYEALSSGVRCTLLLFDKKILSLEESSKKSASSKIAKEFLEHSHEYLTQGAF